jgi:subtilisin-like proprotein convertase family protein
MKNNYLITQPTLLRSVLLAIFAIAGVSMSYAQIIVRDTFLANGSYTVPSGVTTITVQAWGGGGGGGRGFSRSNSAAGGGGGAFSQSALSVSPGDVFSVAIGTGGTGGTQDVAGTNGTATNFGGLVIAPGGFAPVDVIASQFGSNPGLGGPAGTGDITYTGGNGAAKPTNFVGGGGGSSGGTTGNGNNAAGQTGGVAPGFGGNGGDGGSNLAPGLPGFVPGGGGGGKGGGQNVASGNGANGMVIVTYEIPEVELDCPDDVTLAACSSQSAVDDAFNTWLSSFTFTGGCGTPEASFDDEYTAPSACGGSVTVTYRVASDCESDKTCERTFTVTAAPTLSVSCPAAVTIPACSTQDDVDAAFADWIAGFTTTGGCGTVSTNLSGFEAPSFCGGVVNITFTANDDCGQSETCTSTFTVTAAPILSVTCPSAVTIPACSTQDDVDAAFADWIAGFTTSGGCGTVSTNLSGFEAPSFCGGVVNITFTANDDCGQSETCTSTFTVTAAPILSVTCPSAVTIPACSTQDDVDAAFADWIAGFTTSGGCGTASTDLSGFEAPSFCGGVVNITFTANDDCGQSQTCTSTFIVTAAPTLSVTCPAAVTIPACSTQATVDAAFATWIAGFSTTGGCGTVSTDLSGFEAPSFCGGNVSITYTASDNCGQSQTCTSTFTVTAAPTLSVTCPAVVTIPACSTQATVDAAFATWIAGFSTTGGCGTVSTDLSGFEAPSFCGGNVSITYTASDNCGQSQTCTSTFTVTAAPTLSVTCPAVVTIPACSTQATVDAAFATWIAGFSTTGGCGTVSTDLSGFSAPSFCGGSVSITYTASDNCGQAQTCTSTFTVTAAPTLSVTCPSPVTIPSCSTQSAVNAAFAGWIAGFTTTGGCGTVSTNLSGFSAPSFCGGSVSITFTASDNCGQAQSCTSTFTVTAAPTLSVTCPSAVTIPACSTQDDVDAAFADWIAGFSAAGGCGTETTDLSGFEAPSFCGGVVNITFTANDDCGQSETCTSTFTVTAAPTLSVTCPANVTMPACSTQEDVDMAFEEWLTGFSTSGGCNPVTTGLSGFIGGNPSVISLCGGSVTIVYAATDDCGQAVSCSSTFAVELRPTLTVSCPGNETVAACSSQEDVDAAFAAWLEGFGYTGGCFTTATNLENFEAPSFCGGSVTIVYTAEDACDQTASCSATFTVSAAPVLSVSCPGNETIAACTDPEAVEEAFENWIAGFDFDGGCNATGSDLSGFTAPSFCGGSVTVVYSATDDCDQTSSCVAVFTVTSAPVLTVTCPSNETISSCTDQEDVDAAFEEWLESFGFDGGCNTLATDLSDLTAPSFCGGSVTVVYSATDDCDQTSSCVAVFTVESAPILEVTCPGDVTIAACSDQETVDLAYAEWLEGFGFTGGCDATVLTDLGGNGPQNQTFESGSIMIPIPDGNLTGISHTIEVSGAGLINSPEDLSIGISITNGHTWAGDLVVEVAAPGGSTFLFHRLGVPPGTLGNSNDITGSFVFNPGAAIILPESGLITPGNYIPSDNSFPVQGHNWAGLTFPMDPNGNWTITVKDLATLDVGTLESWFVEMETQSAEAPSFCGGSVTINYEVEDACAQFEACEATFTVTPAPTLAVTCPENAEIPACATQEAVDAAFADWLEGFSVTGGCNPTASGLEEIAAPDACGGSVTVVFTATDDCDQTSSCAAVFTVLPVTGLAFDSELPASETVECDNVPEPFQVSASNNCGNVEVSYEEETESGDCAGDYVITRTWTATDCTGSITHTQIVTVQDTQAPELQEDLPGGILENVLKSDAPSAPADSEIAGLYSDNCTGVNAELIDSVIEGTECEWTAIYTYRITDDCGNLADEAVVIYQGIDTQAPVIESCADISIFAEVGECDAVVEIVTPEYSDNCEVTIEGVRNDQLELDDLYPVGTTTITWTAIDEGGNSTVCVQTITVIEAQRITVFGQGIEIENGSVTPIPLDGTKFGSVSLGGMITKTFTITNIGCIDLDLTGSPAVVLTGPGASFFSVVTQPAVTSLAPGSSTTFQVKYTGSAYGVHEATVIIANNDPMNDPFTFAISAATSQAIMRVTGNNITIPNGDVTPQLPDFTDFGVITFNGTRTRTFRVHNDGIANLLLTGNPRVQLFGAGASKFAVTTQPQATITPGANRLFQITFTGDEVGVFVATVSIENTDLGASPYTFDIVATVLPSSMQVRGNNIIIANGDDTPETADNTDFGFWAVGTTRNRTFTVNNVGAGHLFLSGTPRVQLSGPNADQFFVSAQPVALIAPASSSIFRITYAPTAVGNHTAVVTISNNDAANNPYVFTIAGAAALPLKQGGIFEVPYVADKKEVGDMRLYPNPAFDQVFVELPVSDQSYRVEFISIDGRVIHSLQTQGGRLELNVATWKPGMYMMRATGIDVAPVRFIRAE